MNETTIRDTADDAEYRQYVNREMAIMDYNDNMEGAREEGFEQGKLDVVKRMLKSGTLSLEQIADFAALPLEKVKELSHNMA